jgi:hypothetical protein
LSLALIAAPALAQKKYDPGASDTEIKLGQTAPYSGPVSAYGTFGRASVAYFHMINEAGGIGGRKINLLVADDGFSPPKALEQSRTRYFQVLTTPAPEDPDGQMVSYWGPQLDDFFVRVCDNLHLRRDEVYRYLLYPRYFAQIEKLVLEGKLHPAASDSLMQMVIDVGENGASSPPQPFVFVDPRAAPGSLHASPRVQRRQRFRERHVEASGDTLFVWLPEDDARSYQRCVLYRTLHDFLATPIGPTLPEGVLGFVPIHDASLPIVIYASLGEQRLRRTAQHEIAHAVVESIARYLRQMTPTRNRTAQRDSGCTKGWRPGSGGFSMVTHENYAEYLAFPHGQMEPALRAALITPYNTLNAIWHSRQRRMRCSCLNTCHPRLRLHAAPFPRPSASSTRRSSSSGWTSRCPPPPIICSLR